MKKMLVSCVLFVLDGLAIARNVVVVGCDHVSRYLDPIFAFKLTEPPAERRDLIEHGMPQQDAPTARAVQTTADQRPWLDRFVRTMHQPSFA